MSSGRSWDTWTTSNDHLELRVLVLERVVAMGRGDEYLFDARIDEGLDVLLRELLEELLVARLADTFSAADLFVP